MKWSCWDECNDTDYVAAFLKEYGFECLEVYGKYGQTEWRKLSEDEGERLIKFLRMVYGFNKEQTHNMVRRSQSNPYLFYIRHPFFVMEIEEWKKESL